MNRPLSDAPRWAVLFNQGAGSRDASELRARIEHALEALGVAAEWFTPGPGEDLGQCAQRAAASGADTLLAVGGDGSINTAANALFQGQRRGEKVPRLALLPAGTFNHIAARLGVSDDVETALAAAVADGGDGQWLAGGEVNGRLFLNNCSFGAYTDIIEAREAHKRRFGRSRIVAALSALLTLLQPKRRRALIVRQPGQAPLRLRASLVFIGANPVQLQPWSPTLAEAVAQGRLGLMAVRAPGFWALLRVAGSALSRATAPPEELAVALLDEAQLDLRARRLRVVLDGEIVRLRAPLQLRALPQALRVRGAQLPAAS